MRLHLKSITKNTAKAIAAVALIEGLLLAIAYILQNDSLVKWILLIYMVQAIMLLVAFPFVLISVVLSYRRQESSDIQHAVMIWIWQGKAYLPTLAETTPGYFVDVEPVYVANLTQLSLTEAMKKVMDEGHQHEMSSTEDKDPLLTITKAKSREALKEESTVFIVKWTTKFVALELIEAKQNIHQRLQSFPYDVSVETMSKTILNTIKI